MTPRITVAQYRGRVASTPLPRRSATQPTSSARTAPGRSQASRAVRATTSVQRSCGAPTTYGFLRTILGFAIIAILWTVLCAIPLVCHLAFDWSMVLGTLAFILLYFFLLFKWLVFKVDGFKAVVMEGLGGWRYALGKGTHFIFPGDKPLSREINLEKDEVKIENPENQEYTLKDGKGRVRARYTLFVKPSSKPGRGVKYLSITPQALQDLILQETESALHAAFGELTPTTVNYGRKGIQDMSEMLTAIFNGDGISSLENKYDFEIDRVLISEVSDPASVKSGKDSVAVFNAALAAAVEASANSNGGLSVKDALNQMMELERWKNANEALLLTGKTGGFGKNKKKGK